VENKKANKERKEKGKKMRVQIGKHGLSEGIVENIAKGFKTRDLIRISILKSCSRNREEIRKMAEELSRKVSKAINKPIATRIVGFTIIMRKLRK
jgi:RNA-binding protein YhbY